jgi:hypothetical protein
MTLLQITNTGRLNYHLKALGSLISKDEGGRYHLTEQGRQAAGLLRTFPERAPPERKLTGVKVATAVVLILIGVLLISSFAFAFLPHTASETTSERAGIQPQALPLNTTVSLTGWITTVPSFSMAWSAIGPVHVYVLNQTQNDALQLSHSKGSQPLYNFTGPPEEWSEQYYSQSENVTVTLPPGQYQFYAYSSAANYLNSFGLSQTSPPQSIPGGQVSLFFYLYASVFVAIGALLIVLAVSILTHRVWR